jgi:clan AA aspartic protease
MAEEKGFVNENLEAVLPIQIFDGAKIECVLDTGFNGFLLLPREFVKSNSMSLVGRETVLMVEQNATEIDIAAGEIIWLGEKILVRVLISETGDALFGTQMLIDSVLEIDYKNSTVKITK